jgi:hypothetical protein
VNCPRDRISRVQDARGLGTAEVVRCAARLSGIRPRERGVPTYRVHDDPEAIESELEQIPFHPDVLDHVGEPVALDAVERRKEGGGAEDGEGARFQVPPARRSESRKQDQNPGDGARAHDLSVLSAFLRETLVTWGVGRVLKASQRN